MTANDEPQLPDVSAISWGQLSLVAAQLEVELQCASLPNSAGHCW